jgi:hypothetical protein
MNACGTFQELKHPCASGQPGARTPALSDPVLWRFSAFFGVFFAGHLMLRGIFDVDVATF